MSSKIQSPSSDDATAPLAPPRAGSLRIVPLGGLGEFGKNCMVFETGADMLVVDCGLKFPEDEMFGVDMVIPDFNYVFRGEDRLRGLVLTHGHEDHIGAVPYFVRQIGTPKLPVYGTRLTIALVREKLSELDVLNLAELIEVEPFERLKIGDFDLEFLPVTHSMPMAMALAFHMRAGVVLHTGDFKFDPGDDGESGTLRRFADRIGPGGTALLLADSTNSDREGVSPQEASVRDGLMSVLDKAERAAIVAMFSSSLYRAQTIIDLARELGRKVAICGYSLERNFDIAVRLGLIRRHESVTLPLAELARLPPRERLIMTTGTQGEPLSALSRLSLGSYKGYRVEPKDLIVLSSRIIPGNEREIYRMINHFYKRGAKVVTERDARVHASGHAYQGEMRALLERLQPRNLAPVHGEIRQLIGHRDVALSTGMGENQIHIVENGMTLEMDDSGRVEILETDWAGQVLVDGKLIDGVDEVVLRDRRHLSCDGMLTVILVIDQHSHKIIAGPDIVSRGFVLMDQSEALIEKCKELVVATFEETDKESQEEWDVVKAAVRKALRKFLARETDRYPVILPVVVEI